MNSLSVKYVNLAGPMGAKSSSRLLAEREGGTLLDGVMQSINKARRALRMSPIGELPRGVPEKSRLCVLARALHLEILLDENDRPFALTRGYRQARMLANAWSVGKPGEAWNGWSVELPAELSEFVREFDACRHPELIISDFRRHLRMAAEELEALRLRRCQLRALKLRTMRTRARASLLIASGHEIYLRSVEACARSRFLTRKINANPVVPISAAHPPALVEERKAEAAVPAWAWHAAGVGRRRRSRRTAQRLA